MTTTITPASFAVRPAGPSEVARPATATSTEAERRARFVSIYVSSIFAVTMLFLVGVGVPCWLFLDNAAAGIALGAMCAIWGGPSFGVMAASARVSAWHEAEGINF